jgi:hypothetical protein
MSSNKYYVDSLRTLDHHLTETQRTVRDLIKSHAAPSADIQRLETGLKKADFLDKTSGSHRAPRSDLYTTANYTVCLTTNVSVDMTALYCEISNWEMKRVAYDLDRGIFATLSEHGLVAAQARTLEELGFPPGTPMWFKPRGATSLTRIA